MRNAVHLQSDDQINRQYRRASRLLDSDMSIADLATQQNAGAVKPLVCDIPIRTVPLPAHQYTVSGIPVYG